jgi:hypothetical protein
MGVAIAVLGVQAIARAPQFLLAVALVLATAFPVLVKLYSTELARPSFRLNVKLPIGKPGLVTITVQSGQRCPYCHDTLVGSRAHEMITCGACQTVLHKDCLNELGSCPTQGCRNRRKGRLRVYTE